jgi:hypothetical protein
MTKRYQFAPEALARIETVREFRRPPGPSSSAVGKPLRVHEVAAANRGVFLFGDFLLDEQEKVTGPREGTI